MKKKNLVILLIMPFLIALFGIATIKTAFNIIDNDVTSISWQYAENELFKIDSEYKLEASIALADERYPASEGNELVWTVENIDGVVESHARIEERIGDGSYLIPLSEGDIRITCSTKKGNVMPMTMIGFIGDEDKLISINDKIGGSGQSVDCKYYGEYDLGENGAKQPAVIELSVKTFSLSLLKNTVISDYSPNLSAQIIDLDEKNKTFTVRVNIKGASEDMSFVTLHEAESDVTKTYSFKVVSDGINVFDYDDLLACTNRSENGEIVVLRKNFESKSKAINASNVTLFGSENSDFAEEVYKFETTYNSEYIDRWNEFAASNGKYSPVSKTLLAGLRVQKDFYGNGYTVNLHDLCFPSERNSDTGEQMLGQKDLFRGPKPFYLLGDPNGLPVVTAFGQDNVGMYIDGNNITVNDVKLKNCDFGTVMQNLEYVGTVVDVHGDNNKIVNSVLSNGKNVLRCFSSDNFVLDNCILQYARNFLLSVGSDEYEKNELNTNRYTFKKLDGSEVTCTLDEYLMDEGDKLLGYFVSGVGTNDLSTMFDNVVGGLSELPSYPKERVKEALHLLQDAMSRSDKISADDIRGSATINDSVFYYGGVASIGIEQMFNGPFLYNDTPSIVEAIAGMLQGFGAELFPMFPDNVSGSSYPVEVKLSGNTRFYYDKTIENWDISGLIGQNMTTIVGNLGGNLNIDIDDIFPLKKILTEVANNSGSVCVKNGKSYINIPVAFYGGGTNLSRVDESKLVTKGMTEVIDVDLLDSYLNYDLLHDPDRVAELIKVIESVRDGGIDLNTILGSPIFIDYIKEVLIKTVTTVTGFEEFKFQFVNDPEGLFDENGNPKIADFTELQKNR